LAEGRVTAIPACRTCGTQPLENARFCHGCGSPVQDGNTHAEYKQVTVLFADVVHSMDIGATVGAERLREIMTNLVDRASAVVQRYGGTVDKFTGDGIMAVFGAPVALEDHAIRACLAALGIQKEMAQLAAEAKARDGIDLRLRVGLNSGQVIAGEIGSGGLGYTAVGEQVGMAQRTESVAAPCAVMLSESTARLVEGAATLGQLERVRIKGTDQLVCAQRLLGVPEGRDAVGRGGSSLVGRRWELSAVESLLDRAVDGQGAVVGVVGSPGIGKSRLVREVAAMAHAHDVDVFTAFCESHTSQVPFHGLARLLRAATGIKGLDPDAARARIRAQFPDAEPEDLVLFDDLLGVADPEVELPKIDPDARRRRLTALVNAASLARESPRVYVIEDAHWIDEVSESMLAAFLMVIPQTPSLVLVTYRPEYRGPLSRVADAHTVALGPLSDSETTALVLELLGDDPSVGELCQKIAERAAGNPFFAEEMVRELAERGVLRGNRSAYVSTVGAAEVSVPATVQATIAARIDRLDPAAKRTLSAAAVIGSKFSRDLLETLGIDPVLDDLAGGELIDQITITGDPAYVFHHPLIRTVAYEAQLKSDRAELHRRVAAVIQRRGAGSVEENAALIAEHLGAAGDLREAFGWHMRAGAWLNFRDIKAARLSWQHARQVADRLPADETDIAGMRIAPRSVLCGTAFRVYGLDEEGLDELRELSTKAGNKVSLAMAMAGHVMALFYRGRYRESSALASQLVGLLESIGDSTLTVALTCMAIVGKWANCEMGEVLRLASTVINLADGDALKGNLILESPLCVATMGHAAARLCGGEPGWKHDIERGAAMGRDYAPVAYSILLLWKYRLGLPSGALLADSGAVQESADAVELAQRYGDDLALEAAHFVRGLILAQQDSPGREEGLRLLGTVREVALQRSLSLFLPVIDLEFARENARTRDFDTAIELLRQVADRESRSGDSVLHTVAAGRLVESLLARGADADIDEADTQVQRLACAAQADSGLAIEEIWLLRLRALLARARADAATYADLRDRYRDMARTLGFEGHIAWADAMP
jgi:class 3 adenylate cyclase